MNEWSLEFIIDIVPWLVVTGLMAYIIQLKLQLLRQEREALYRERLHDLDRPRIHAQLPTPYGTGDFPHPGAWVSDDGSVL